MTILTFKVRLENQFIIHNTKRQKHRWYDFRRKINKYMRVARKIAEYAIKPENRKKSITSKTVKHLGKIPSNIACQVVRKYKNNDKCKNITNIILPVQALNLARNPSIVHTNEELNIKPLKLKLKWKAPVKYEKINCVEINNEYLYIIVTVADNEVKREYTNFVGVDMNLKPSIAVVADPNTKEHKFVGYGCIQKRIRYNEIRRRFQRQRRPQKIKEMNNKEHRVIRDLNYKIAKELCEFAINHKSNLVIEDLTGIRRCVRKGKGNKNTRKFVNSWAFYSLRIILERKAKSLGITVTAVNPAYTSQDCSNCGERTKTKTKKYHCPHCGLEEHRDINACYNIAKRATIAE